MVGCTSTVCQTFMYCIVCKCLGWRSATCRPRSATPPTSSRSSHPLENVGGFMLGNFEVQNGGTLVWYDMEEEVALVADYTVVARTVGSNMC